MVFQTELSPLGGTSFANAFNFNWIKFSRIRQPAERAPHLDKLLRKLKYSSRYYWPERFQLPDLVNESQKEVSRSITCAWRMKPSVICSVWRRIASALHFKSINSGVLFRIIYIFGWRSVMRHTNMRGINSADRRMRPESIYVMGSK